MEQQPQGRSRGRARGIVVPVPAGRGNRPILLQQDQGALAPIDQSKRKTGVETGNFF